MDFDLDEGQSQLQDAIAHAMAKYRVAPVSPVFDAYDTDLERDLEAGGYFEVMGQEGYGPIDAALTVETLAKLPRTAEIGASLLVAPKLLAEALPRPIALLSRAGIPVARFLAQAKTAIIDMGDDVLILDLAGTERAVCEGLYAYPFGAFTRPPDLSRARRLGAAAAPVLRQWWRIAIAMEAVGALQAAMEFTVGYLKDRRQFGRPLGSFQAIQHRLAQGTSLIQGLRWLALTAAWNEDPRDAALAATFAQEAAQTVAYDLHQFSGALGLTLEHPLHFWTYRLKALQGELGAVHAQAAAAADLAWPAR